MKKSFALLENEFWWGGVVNAGTEMPFQAGKGYDLRGDNFGNQAAPFLVSSAGRYIWSEEPFCFQFKRGGGLAIESTKSIVIRKAGSTLKSAYLEASKKFFPPKGKLPETKLFTAPQYNTWIELMYDQNQTDILEYAKNILRQGYTPGVLMIDEGWAKYYGDWEFDPIRFPNPKKLIQQLHKMGFKVMLWIVPFIVPDSHVYRALRNGNVLVKNSNNKPAIREWWNGHSAVVDVTGGEGKAWFQKRLDYLQKEYGVDGFKFDAGDTPYYRSEDKLAVPTSSNGHTEAFGKLGLRYSLNEYRACWKCGGEPLVQRLRDRSHTWDHQGLNCLVPNTIAQGLLGYSFVCPDMIGGGDYESFLQKSAKLDPELFVRSAQASALMPMMQYSAAPWRILSKKHSRLCLEAARLHLKFAPTILKLAKESSKTGEPIVRHMAYEFPGLGLEKVSDQFMLGSDILVAPVLQKGVKSRIVHLPSGQWKADDGKVYEGSGKVEIQTPLERLPYFTRTAKN